jgi:hypothetical protein
VLIAWSAPSHTVIEIRAGRIYSTLDSTALGHKTLPLAVSRVGDDLEVIDATGRVATYSSTGPPKFRPIPLSAGARIAAATRSGAGWTLVVVAGPTVSLVDLSCAGPSRNPTCEDWRLRVIAAVGDKTHAGQSPHVTGFGSKSILTFTAPPFDGQIVDSSGRIAHFEPVALPATVATVSPQDVPLWASLPVLPAGDVLIQTITDLRSDRRILVLRDASGRIVRQSNLDAPLGFVGSSSALREVYGGRTTSRNELIIYRLCGEPDYGCARRGQSAQVR